MHEMILKKAIVVLTVFSVSLFSDLPLREQNVVQ